MNVDDLLLIAELAALIALGFAAIQLILGSLRKNRRYVFGCSASRRGKKTGDMGKKLDKYEHTGILDFDDEEPSEAKDPLGL